jgi:hypothetical protein
MRNVSVVFIASLLLAGCAQGEGDRCQVTSDCESGLECKMEVCTGKKAVVPQQDGGVFPTPDAAPIKGDAAANGDALGVTPVGDSGAVDAPVLQSVDTSVIPDAAVDASAMSDAQE